MSKADGDRQVTFGELARAIERGTIRSAVRGVHYEVTWRDVNRLRLRLADADIWLLFQPSGGIEFGPGGEDISQAI